MQLFARETSINSIASALSLVVANYKPIPQLPTSNSTSSNGVSSAKKMVTVGGKTVQQTFLTQSASKAAELDESLWGEGSVLYVPQSTSSSSSTANSFASSATIGPGNCPIQQTYTPVGGWSALPAPEFSAFDPVMANVYRYRQQQGVNLGAWFVQEGWMQSDFFSCSTGGKQAEYDVLDGFGQTTNGVKNATAYMEKHWDTWITEDDFKKMAKMGINTVRLPIGYWSAGPYFTNSSPFSAYAPVYYYSWRYIARAINWAAKYNIGVLVDLHGAYGSQNGQPHSGLSDGNVEFYNSYNMGLTTDLLVWITGQLANVTNIVGIQLLNEPQDKTSLWTWYTSTMTAMRKVSATMPLYFHDAFNLEKGAAFVAKRTDFAVQDHHSYYVYTSSDTSMSAKAHIQEIKGSIRQEMLNQSSIARRNVIVGEWSCALAPSSLSQAKNETIAQYNFCNNQEKVYRESEAGWTFWSWKMEDCASNGGWCFQQAVGTNLPSSFDSWGLATKTAALFKRTATANTTLATLKSTISLLALPTLPTALSTKAKVNQVSDEARIGMVLPSTSKREWQSGSSGSFASRANQLVQGEKRASSTSAFATQAGWSDGFKSTRIFASYGSLSRLGFAQQYQLDSFAARLATGKVSSSDSSAYADAFSNGVTSAESLIAAAVSKLSG